mgnify:CR=1 FL=1
MQTNTWSVSLWLFLAMNIQPGIVVQPKKAQAQLVKPTPQERATVENHP